MNTILVSLAVVLVSMHSALGEQITPNCRARIIPPFQSADQTDRVKFLPGLGCVDDLQLSGYLPTSDPVTATSSQLYYWFVGSHNQPEKDPIVVWLNGGPGASGFYGFFSENGPYTIDGAGKLSVRSANWTAQTNFLMIEQAATVGLSYAAPHTHFKNEAQVIEELNHALHAFFIRYPEFADHPLYLAGESYAGKYIPKLAHRILKYPGLMRTKHSKVPHLNLQGLLIGDAWVNPLVQQSANADYAYSHGLIDSNVYKKVNKLYQDCAREIKKQIPSSRTANQVCMKMQELIHQSSGVHRSDIRTLAECDYTPIVKYLNQSDVRSSLHVDPRVGEFQLFSESLSKDLEIGIQDSAADLYPELLKTGVRVLVFSGLDDGTDSNFMGTEKWLAALNWVGKKEFSEAPTCIWESENKDVAGYARSARGLTQVKIRGAGHMAPMDQPIHVQDMLHRFISQRSFCQKKEN